MSLEVEVGGHNHFKLRTTVLEDDGATKRKELGSEAYHKEESCPLTSETCTGLLHGWDYYVESLKRERKKCTVDIIYPSCRLYN